MSDQREEHVDEVATTPQTENRTTAGSRPSMPAAPARPAAGGPSAVVVGAGFGGLAAALRLTARGYRVTLVERQPDLGGRARVFHRNGFTFDAGPTVITAPFLLEELFGLFGKRLADHVALVPVTPWYRVRFADGRHFDYGGTVDDTVREIERFNPADGPRYRQLLEHSRRIFEKGFVELGDQPFGRFPDMLRQIPDLVRLRAERSVYGFTARYIEDESVRRVFSLQPMLVGGNPFRTTCIYSLIHYLEREWGVWFAKGGTRTLVDALARLLVEAGGTIRTSATVTRIDIRDRRARGVTLEDGTALPADVVVVNGDPPYVYKRLIDPAVRRRWTDRKIDRLKYSMGLYVLYFATRRSYPDVAHHTIIFGERYRELLRDVFERQILADDFGLYLHRPAATDPSMAPPGHDVFYVLSPVPNLQSGVDWSTEAPRYRERILAALERAELPGLREHLVEAFEITPDYFRDELLSEHGAGFSIAPLFRQSAWFRFHNKAEDLEDLYFVGAGTHPGAGVPGVLTSAKVLDRVVPAAAERPAAAAGPAP